MLLLRLPICFAALAALAPLPLQLPCRLQPPPFAARPRPRLFGSNRAAAARANYYAVCFTRKVLCLLFGDNDYRGYDYYGACTRVQCECLFYYHEETRYYYHECIRAGGYYGFG